MSVTAPNQSGAAQNQQMNINHYQNQSTSAGLTSQASSLISTSDNSNQPQYSSNTYMVSQSNPISPLSPLINMISQTSISNSNPSK